MKGEAVALEDIKVDLASIPQHVRDDIAANGIRKRAI